MKSTTNPSLAARWKKWGCGYIVPPWSHVANLEQLLIDTARHLGQDARLLVMTVTWLTEHHRLVDVDYLATLAQKLDDRQSAQLGLLLDMAQEFIGEDVFSLAMKECRPCRPPRPLYDLDRSRPVLARLARQQACAASHRWGLWTPPVALKHDAMRPASWIAANNASFMLRALLKGDVRSKVIAALSEDGLVEVSETHLTRRAGCTRRAMHLALENLEASGLIRRCRRGRNYAITLNGKTFPTSL